jgi:hypothetical protein
LYGSEESNMCIVPKRIAAMKPPKIRRQKMMSAGTNHFQLRSNQFFGREDWGGSGGKCAGGIEGGIVDMPFTSPRVWLDVRVEVSYREFRYSPGILGHRHASS